MYIPTFTITNLILDYIIKFEVSNSIIDHTPLPFKYKFELYEKFKSEEIQAISDLIGFPMGLQKAMEIQGGKILSTQGSPYTIFNNYRSVQDFIKSYNRQQFIQPSTQLLTHINKLVLSGIVDDWEYGKYRRFSEKPNEIYDSWYKHRDFYPDIEPVKYFDELFEWMLNPKIKIHKLIQLCIFVFEMIDKAPLQTGNQLTAILTFSAAMKDMGYNPDNILPIGKIFNFLNEDLVEAFKLSKTRKDLTIFIEALLYSLSLEMLNVENNVTNTHEQKVKKHIQQNRELNPRQNKILEYLQFNGKISRQEYSKMMGISFMTAFRDLNELLEHKYISQKGAGRGTYYLLVQDEVVVEKEKLKVFSE
jgi:Fic family protein